MKFFINIFFVFFLAFSGPVFAKYDFGRESGLNTTAGQSGYTLDSSGNAKDIFFVKIGVYINFILSLLGVVFLVLMFYAGYTWFMAQDDKNEIQKAQTTLKNAIFGLIIVLAAYGITYFVLNNISSSVIN